MQILMPTGKTLRSFQDFVHKKLPLSWMKHVLRIFSKGVIQVDTFCPYLGVYLNIQIFNMGL